MDRKGGALIHLPEGLLHAILEILRKIYKKLGKRDQIKIASKFEIKPLFRTIGPANYTWLVSKNGMRAD